MGWHEERQREDAWERGAGSGCRKWGGRGQLRGRDELFVNHVLAPQFVLFHSSSRFSHLMCLKISVNNVLTDISLRNKLPRKAVVAKIWGTLKPACYFSLNFSVLDYIIIFCSWLVFPDILRVRCRQVLMNSLTMKYNRKLQIHYTSNKK